MNYLILENVTKSYGDKILFENISLRINKGEKVALVAKNGTGKTTLLKVIAGIEGIEGENAKVLLRNNIRIGFLDQDPQFYEDDTILEAVLDSDDEKIKAIKNYETTLILYPNDTDKIEAATNKMDDIKAWDFEAKIKEILFKLNITQLDRKISVLSGGQKKRLALAKLIVEEPDFLILDEPTNHLDLEMIEWLEKYMQKPNVTLFMVTHDRYFLQLVCNRIVELEDGKIYNYSGNYSDFIHKKTTRFENNLIQYDKNKKLLKKELNWVNRMPKARGTKAKSRVDKFYELKEKTSKRPEKKQIKIDIKTSRLGGKILETHYLTKSFDDFKIVEDFNYKFKKGERIGIVGKNGVGKTTFLELLMQNIRPDSGKIVVGGTVIFGYYTQDGMILNKDKRVIDVITDIAEYIPLEKGQKITAPVLLERFLFDRKHQKVYVSQLSGGEKRRLYLLTVLMKNPNFLILDEPTNDLDVITLNILEEFLEEFPGCLLVVTHDRFFLDKLVDHLFIFEGEGKIKDFNGTYAEYKELKAANSKLQREAGRSKNANQKESNTDNDSEEKKQKKLGYEQRKQIGRIEKAIEKLEKRKAEIHEEFNRTDLTPKEIEDFSTELSELKGKIEGKEAEWMNLVD